MRTHRSLLVLGAYALLAVSFTWPLARNVDTWVKDLGDPLLNAWILDWDVYALTTCPQRYFHAPIFHPETFALAHSEHLSGLLLWAAPIILCGGSPILAHNICILAGLTFAGWGFWVLAQRYYGALAAFCGGVLYAFCHYTLGQLGHVQVLALGWFPLMLYFLQRISEEGRQWRDYGGATVCLLFAGLSNGYYLYYAFLLGIAWLFTTSAVARNWRAHMLRGACFILLAVLVMAPFCYAYLVVDASPHRELNEIKEYAVRWTQFLSVDIHHPWARFFGDPPRDGPLFPGVLLLVLGVMGVFLRGVGPRWLACLLVAGAAWVALGPDYGLYDAFMRILSGFDGLRVPPRIMPLAYLGLALLSARFLHACFERLSSIKAVLLAAALMGWQGLEMMLIPKPGLCMTSNPAPVDLWLASVPPGPIAMLPLCSKANAFGECRRMLRTRVHRLPMVNGYSGFWPSWYWVHQPVFNDFPSPASLRALRTHGVRYVVFYPDDYSDALLHRADAERADGVVLRFVDDAFLVYELLPCD